MRYTLIVTDHNYNLVMELCYDVWSQVRECAELMCKGVKFGERTFDVEIKDNETHQRLWSASTY